MVSSNMIFGFGGLLVGVLLVLAGLYWYIGDTEVGGITMMVGAAAIVLGIISLYCWKKEKAESPKAKKDAKKESEYNGLIIAVLFITMLFTIYIAATKTIFSLLDTLLLALFLYGIWRRYAIAYLLLVVYQIISIVVFAITREGFIGLGVVFIFYGVYKEYKASRIPNNLREKKLYGAVMVLFILGFMLLMLLSGFVSLFGDALFGFEQVKGAANYGDYTLFEVPDSNMVLNYSGDFELRKKGEDYQLENSKTNIITSVRPFPSKISKVYWNTFIDGMRVKYQTDNSMTYLTDYPENIRGTPSQSFELKMTFYGLRCFAIATIILPGDSAYPLLVMTIAPEGNDGGIRTQHKEITSRLVIKT
ncbi:MAG: hypothetical protein PHG85_04190 [Candidatus Altiarchaeota archaeon]|nr:hypothetical protein [Candidatus Altiarchaeota archaeon]